jgi:hypothetical protein
MAVSLQALLDLKAQVSGTAAVKGMSTALTGVQTAAGRTTGALKTMASSAGGLGGAMGALVPLLSVGGLAAMAKSSLDAGNAMYDLSQKTGVSVEALARFKRAARSSGTDIEAIAKAMVKLGVGMAKTSGPAVNALKELGISAKDASGKLKTADAVTLEIANKFKALQDPGHKARLAVALFGKAGSDLIPMLNMGGSAIESLSVKMTTAFAQKADAYSDKLAGLSGKVGALGADILVALLPAMEAITNAVIAGVDAFNKLPDGIKGVVVVIAALAIALPLITVAIGAVVGAVATIAPLLAGVSATLAGIGTVISVVLGLLASPAVLIGALVIAVGVAIYTFRDQIGAFFTWLYDTWLATTTAVGKFFYDHWIAPNIEAAKVLWDYLKAGWQGLSNWITGAFTAIGNLFQTWVVKPISGAWQTVVNAGKGALNGLLSWSASIINRYIDMVNSLISKTNSISAKVKIPAIPLIPRVQAPKFAEGAYVTGPTVAEIGEGGQPEYVVPAGKAGAFAMNYLSGARGADAIPAGSSPGGFSTAGGGSASINIITTGPVLQQGGQTWVTMDDLRQATRQTAQQLLAQLSTPAGRRSIGVTHG